MRWSGPFPTPNVAGMEMATLAAICVVLAVRCRTKNGEAWKRAAYWGLMGVALIAMVLLAMSSSRAGVLAEVVAMVVLGTTGSISWTMVWSLLGFQAVTILSMHDTEHRFVISAPDASIRDRCRLWRSVLSMIADHPWTGVGMKNFQEVLDRWYLPADLTGRFATALNEPLTVAAAWGLPVLGGLAFLYAALLSIGLRMTRHHDVPGTCGVIMLLTHAIGGLFQGHVFAWWQVQAGWVVGAFLILCSRAVLARISADLRWAVGGGIAVPVMLWIAIMASGPLGDWQTGYIHAEVGAEVSGEVGAELVAWPRHHDCTGVVVVIHAADAPAPVLREWIANRKSESVYLILADHLPDRSWWLRLHAFTDAVPGHRCLATADGEAGSSLWEGWRSGQVDVPVMVTNPTAIPDSAWVKRDRPSLQIRLGSMAPFIDSAAIQSRLSTDGVAPAIIIRHSTATWWSLWP